jgi:predicted GNAT family N-acyltransferase
MKTVNLLSSHYREDFECGKDLLDNYLKKQANQDVKKKLSACFVISEEENGLNKVKGYYTLSNSSIPREMLPEKFNKSFPKSYKAIPVTLLGRLALDKSLFGKGIGEYLLLDALKKSHLTAKEVASFAVVVDPIDDYAISFYGKYGFILIPDSGKMFLPMKTIDELFS